MHWVWFFVFLQCNLPWGYAIKIGVSKTSTTTTLAPITTTTAIENTNPTISTTSLPEEVSTSSTRLELEETTELVTENAEITTSKELTSKSTKTSRSSTQSTPAITTNTIAPTLKSLNDSGEQNIVAPLATTSATNGTTQTAHSVYCACNLLPQACDINCCCDPDCTAQALIVFQCPLESAVRTSTHQDDFVLQHNFQFCKINGGWLCIFRTNPNRKPQRVYNPVMDLSTYYKWPSPMLDIVPQAAFDFMREFYKYGEPLQLINVDNLEVAHFELPSTFINARCHIKEPVRHLQPLKRYCLVGTSAELRLNKRELLHLIEEHKLLQRPLLELEHAYDDQLLLRNARQIDIKRCVVDAQNTSSRICEKINATELDQENYYALQIELHLQHNFTHVQKAELRFYEQALNSTQPHDYWQTFVVNFYVQNETVTETESEWLTAEEGVMHNSGALGYLQGEPIIVAKMMSLNESLDLKVLDYWHPKAKRLRSQHTLALMSRRQALCYKNQRTASKEHLINYGINVLRQCKVHLKENVTSLDEKPYRINFTAICWQLQALANQQLLLDVDAANVDLWFSQLGTPRNFSSHPNNSWVRLQRQNEEAAPIFGIYNKLQGGSFTCQNMLLNVGYEFIIVRRMVEPHVPPQQLIESATLHFGRRHDVEFGLHERLELPLSMSVMFYDQAEQEMSGGVVKKVARIMFSICFFLTALRFVYA